MYKESDQPCRKQSPALTSVKELKVSCRETGVSGFLFSLDFINFFKFERDDSKGFFHHIAPMCNNVYKDINYQGQLEKSSKQPKNKSKIQIEKGAR